jgi:prevent-host-death family protein
MAQQAVPEHDRISTWPVQDAKQHFSEVLNRAHTEGEQVVTKHGREVAVILDIEHYRSLKRRAKSFKEHLSEFPKLGDDVVDELQAMVDQDRAGSVGRSFEPTEALVDGLGEP